MAGGDYFLENFAPGGGDFTGGKIYFYTGQVLVLPISPKFLYLFIFSNEICFDIVYKTYFKLIRTNIQTHVQ